MPKHNFATRQKLAQVLPVAADAAGRQSRGISLKYATTLTLLALIEQGNAAPVTLTLMQAQDVAGTGLKPLQETVPIWANQAAQTGDTLVRQGDALAFTTSAFLGSKEVVFHIDPAALDVNNGFKAIFITTSASNAANVVGVLAIAADNAYGGNNMPSMLID